MVIDSESATAVIFRVSGPLIAFLIFSSGGRVLHLLGGTSPLLQAPVKQPHQGLYHLLKFQSTPTAWGKGFTLLALLFLSFHDS